MAGGRVAKRRRNLEHILLLDSTDQQQQQQQLVRVTDDVHSKDAIDHIQHKECATINDSYASRGRGGRYGVLNTFATRAGRQTERRKYTMTDKSCYQSRIIIADVLNKNMQQ